MSAIAHKVNVLQTGEARQDGRYLLGAFFLSPRDRERMRSVALLFHSSRARDRLSPLTRTLPVVFALGLMSGCSRTSVHARVNPPPANAYSGVGPGITGATVLIEPQSGVGPIVKLLDSANTSIFVEAYILTQHRIIRALERAATQGVNVYALLDPHPFGLGTSPAGTAAQLAAAGVHVRWSWARYVYTHAKFMVLDDRTAIVSTANFSGAAFTVNREIIAVDRRRNDVHDLSNVFRSDWDHLDVRSSNRNLVLSPASRPILRSLLQRASREIDVYAEEVADPALDRFLERVGRRVRVRVLVASTYDSSGLSSLRSGPVQVRRLSTPYIHAKALVVDRSLVFVGSENLSPTSLDLNREVGLVLRGVQARRIARVFQQDWTRAVATYP